MSLTLYTLCGAEPSQPFSPHCWKVVMALHHKGLSFEEKPFAFTKIPTIGDGFSPTVPVLEVDGRLMRESFDIALYLEQAYPDRPTLFAGEGGVALSRFVEGFSQTVIHSALTRMIILDIFNMLAPADQAYFRESREQRLGQTLEAVAENWEVEREAFGPKLQPVRHALKSQPFLGGDKPLFADYILFGAFQWARVCSSKRILEPGDSVADWFERCLDLFEGAARATAAA